MSQTYTLPDRLDTVAAQGLADALKSRINTPITLDGAGVESAGTLSLQVLVAAARQWNQDQCSFTLENPSTALIAACGTLGITTDEIGCSSVDAE